MKIIKKIQQKAEDASLGKIWIEWKWMYQYTKQYRWQMIAFVGLSVSGILMGLVSSVASKNLIDIVTGYQTSRIMTAAVLMAGMSVCSLLLGSFSSRISAKMNLCIQSDIKESVFEELLDVEWLQLSSFHSGDILNRFSNDTKTVASSAVGWLPQLITGSFRFLASLSLILYYDRTMALLALINAPVMLLVSRVLVKSLRKHTEAVKETDSEMVAFQEETFYNLDSIKSFDLTGIFTGKLKNIQKQYRDVNLEYNKFSIFTNMILSLLGMCVEFSCFGWGIYRLWSGKITFGEMSLFLAQANHLSAAFQSVVSIVPSAVSATVSAGRIMELIQLPKEKGQEERKWLEEQKESGFQISLDKIFFGYTKEKEILQDASLKAFPGEIAALVGTSGEGKTTLVRMILGLIQPGRGEAVLITERGKRVVLGADLRKYFAYVPQGNTLFSGTVAENLRMVKEDATEEEMIEALKTACAYEFVEKLPLGINSPLGEKGYGLSEGQAQRIAIARAVLRNAPVLLLDEATSALDVSTECRVLKNLVRRYPNRTCIITTHRPSVLSMCQRIYRVMDGKVTERSIKW